MAIVDGRVFSPTSLLGHWKGAVSLEIILLLSKIKSEQSPFSPLFTKEIQKCRHKESESSKEPMLRVLHQKNGANNSSASVSEFH